MVTFRLLLTRDLIVPEADWLRRPTRDPDGNCRQSLLSQRTGGASGDGATQVTGDVSSRGQFW